MAKVSRTTTEKRQIASTVFSANERSPSMAAYGNVDDGAHRPEITPQGEISGYIYCVAQVSTGRDTIASKVIWSAEQDGSISLRSPITGKPLHSKDMDIPSKGKSFVRCLTVCRDLVWAGYADGHLRAYKTDGAHEMVFEKKRHAGGINAVVPAADNKIICTASDDFRIVLWSVDEMAFLHQLPGHSNRVKALAVDGAFLFSGGDDGFVRCWNIADKAEVVVPGQYPFHAHAGGVKTLAISDNVVFTGGEGGVSLWDIETTGLIHVFHSPSPILKMAIVDADVAIWACGADGVITVWDLYDFGVVGRITAHASTGINDVKVMARSVANKLFCITTKSLEVAYVESDGMRPGYEAVPDDVAQLHRKIDDLRDNVVKNAGLLRERAKHLRQLQAIDTHQKRVIRDALSEMMSGALKRSYFDKALTFLRLRQKQNKRDTIASTMLANTARGLSFLYFTRWIKFQRMRKDYRQREVLVGALLRNTQRGLQSLYLKQALEFVRQKENGEARLQAAEVMMAQTSRGLQRVVYFKFLRWLRRQQHLAKRENILKGLLRNTDRGLATIYLNKLAKYAKVSQKRRVRAAAGELLLSTTVRGQRLVAFEAWRKLVAARRYKRQKEGVVAILARSTDSALRRTYLSKLVALVAGRRKLSLQDKIERLDARVATLDAIVNDPSVLSEAELDEKIRAATTEIETLERDIEEAHRCIEDLETRAADLRAELADNAAVDPSKPLSQQIDTAVQLLKGRGLNCKAHLDIVTDTSKKLAAPKAPKPQSQFAKAVQEFKEASEHFLEPGRTAQPDEMWPLDGDAINKASRAILRKTLLGARRAMVIWDHISAAAAATANDGASAPTAAAAAAPAIEGGKDFLLNVTWAMQMISRENKLGVEGAAEAPASSSSAAAAATNGSAVAGGGGTSPRSGSASPRGKPATRSVTPAASPSKSRVKLAPGAAARAASTTGRPAAKPAAKTSATASTSSARPATATSSSAAARPSSKPSTTATTTGGTTTRGTTSSNATRTRATTPASSTAARTTTAQKPPVTTRPGAKPSAKPGAKPAAKSSAPAPAPEAAAPAASEEPAQAASTESAATANPAVEAQAPTEVTPTATATEATAVPEAAPAAAGHEGEQPPSVQATDAEASTTGAAAPAAN